MGADVAPNVPLFFEKLGQCTNDDIELLTDTLDLVFAKRDNTFAKPVLARAIPDLVEFLKCVGKCSRSDMKNLNATLKKVLERRAGEQQHSMDPGHQVKRRRVEPWILEKGTSDDPEGLLPVRSQVFLHWQRYACHHPAPEHC